LRPRDSASNLLGAKPGTTTKQPTQIGRLAANAMSRQAYRLESHLESIRLGAQERLNNRRAGEAVWQVSAKEAEFAHLVVAGYRSGYFTPIAAVVRTLFEDTTLLAWMALPDDPQQQATRAIQVLRGFYSDARNRGLTLPLDAIHLLTAVTGSAARKPPSMEDRVRQLDKHERSSGGKEFWTTHLDHVALLNDYVHANLSGPGFPDPVKRELLGFSALFYGHQYLALGIVSAVRLSDQNRLATQAQAAYERTHQAQSHQLERLVAAAATESGASREPSSGS
jgi:hypothetical protein